MWLLKTAGNVVKLAIVSMAASILFVIIGLAWGPGNVKERREHRKGPGFRYSGSFGRFSRYYPSIRHRSGSTAAPREYPSAEQWGIDLRRAAGMCL